MNDKIVTRTHLPTVSAVINRKLPYCDETGKLLFSEDSINHVIQVTPEQAKQLEALEMNEVTTPRVYARGMRPDIMHVDEAGFMETLPEGTQDGRRPEGKMASPVHGRKKSKKKSSHLPNMNNRAVKAALGGAILGMLGKVQQTHTDAAKRELLKDASLSSVIETVAGKELPAYQRRLLDLNQARAEGSLKQEIEEALGSLSPGEIAAGAHDHTEAGAEAYEKMSKEIFPNTEVTPAPIA